MSRPPCWRATRWSDTKWPSEADPAKLTPLRSITSSGRPLVLRCASYLLRSSVTGAGSRRRQSQNSATKIPPSRRTSTLGLSMSMVDPRQVVAFDSRRVRFGRPGGPKLPHRASPGGGQADGMRAMQKEAEPHGPRGGRRSYQPGVQKSRTSLIAERFRRRASPRLAAARGRDAVFPPRPEMLTISSYQNATDRRLVP
jgi:hypothetical protein